MQIIPRWLYVMLVAVAFVTASCHVIEHVPQVPPTATATPVLIPTAIIQQTSTISATANLLPTVTPTPIPTTTVRSMAANVLPAPLYFLGEDQQIWRLSGNDFTYWRLTAESQPIIDFDVSLINGSLIYLVKANVPAQQEVPTQLIMTDAWGHNREILAEVTESSTIRWSPDGKQYAYDGPEGIYIASPGSVLALRIPLKHNIDFERFTVESWSPDGRSLLVYQWGGGPGWNSYVFNTEDETMVGLAGGCCTPTWRYDSSGLYFAIAGLGEVHPGLWFVSATTGESSPMVQPLQSTGDLLPWAAYPYSNKDFLRAFIGTEPPAAGWPYFLTMVQINDADTLSPLRLDEHQVQEVLWSTDGSGAVMVGYPETKAELPNGEISWLVADDQPPVKLGVRGHDLRWGSTATEHSLSIPTPTPAFSQTNAPATDQQTTNQPVADEEQATVLARIPQCPSPIDKGTSFSTQIYCFGFGFELDIAGPGRTDDEEVHLLLLPADSNSLDRQHPDDAYVKLDIHPVPVVADPIQNEIDTNCRSQPAQDEIALRAANLAINRYQVVLTEYHCGQEELLLKELRISHPPSPTVRVTVAALSGTDSAMFDKIFNALLESFTFYNSDQLASSVPTKAAPTFTPTPTATPAPTIMVGTPVPNIVEQIGDYTVRIWNGSDYPDHLPGRGYYGTATLTHVDGRELIIPDANQVQPLPVSDINGDGYPDVALLMRAGGSHCCQGTAVYSLDDVPTQLVETWGNPYSSGGRGDFRDLNQDGIFEFVIKGLPFGDSGLAVLHYVPNQGYIGGSYRFPQVYEEVLPEIVAHAEQFPDDPFAVDDVAINYLYMGLPIEAWINVARIYEVASRYRDLFDLHEELTRKAIHSHLFAAKPPGIRVIDDFDDQLESIAQTYQINDAGNRNQLTTSVLQLDSPRYWASYAVSHQLLLEYDMQGEAGQRYVGLERCFDEVQDWSQTPILDTAIRNPTDHPVTFFLQFGEGKRCGTEPFTGEVWRTAFMLQPNESRVLTLPLNSFDYFMRTGWSPQQNGAIDLQQIGYFAFGVETDEPREGVLHVSPIRLWP